MKSRFKKGPGLIFDWISMMSLKLNDRIKWLSSVTRIGYEEEDLSHIEYWMKQFDKPHSNLRLFFYLPDAASPSCFMELFRDRMEQRKVNLIVEDLWTAYEDEEYIKDCVAKFYFGELAGQLTLSGMGSRLRESELPGDMQALILGFFIDAQTFIQCLKEWTKKYHQKTLEIYSKHVNEILIWQEKVENSELREIYLHFGRGSVESVDKAYNIENVIFSQAIIMKNTCVMGTSGEDDVWYVLGSDFRETIYAQKNPPYKIHELCNALGDSNRQAIMEFIMAEGEKNTTEVAKKLNSSFNTAAYHLEVMQKARLLGTRGYGKSHYFWINVEACRALAKQIQKWTRYIGYE